MEAEDDMLVPIVKPILFQLVSGNWVRLVFGEFWAWTDCIEPYAGIPTRSYSGIRVYCTEDTFPRRLAFRCEFREGFDFPARHAEAIFDYLAQYVQSRAVYSHDDLESFLATCSEVFCGFDGAREAWEYFEEEPRRLSRALKWLVIDDFD